MLNRGLRGVEAGIIGGLAMIAVLTLTAWLRGYDWWEPANLLGSTFYGARAFRSGPGWGTLAGYALHFVISGVLGFGFALACGELQRRGRLVLLGAVAGLVWYFLAAVTFWTWINPLVPLYALQPDTVMAHAVFGACLGRVGNPARWARFEAAESALPPPLPFDPPPLPPRVETDEAGPPWVPVAMAPYREGESVSSAQGLEDKVE